jgi:hypothetical protein
MKKKKAAQPAGGFCLEHFAGQLDVSLLEVLWGL